MRNLFLLLALASVILLSGNTAYANTPQPAKGEITYSVVSTTYINDPSGIPYYDIVAAGNFAGDMSGPFTAELLAIQFPNFWQTYHGTTTCDPCTLFGKTGTISFRLQGTQPPFGQGWGTLSITGGTDELSKISGGGTFKGSWIANQWQGTYDMTIDLGQ